MGFLDRIAEAKRGDSPALSWPVRDVVGAPEFGHPSPFDQEKYADYIVTSNEIFSVVSLRARQMAGLQLNLYRGRDADKQLAPANHPAVRVLDYVNPFWSAERLNRMDEMSMGIWGESYWAVEKDSAGVPTEIWWLKPTRVKPVEDRDKYLKGFVYTSATGERIPFRPDEIVWFRYPHPGDEFAAMSPLAAARLAADTAAAMTRSAEQLHNQGLQLGGVIVPAKDKVTFKQGQAEELEQLLDKRWSKPKNRARWSVLRYEAQFLPMNITPKDAESLGGLNLSLRQVLNAYGVPSPLLNDLEHSTLANLKELTRWLWEGALQPDAKLRAAEIREQFLPMFKGGNKLDWAEYDFTKIAALQESQSEAWTREAQAMDRGALLINEWRRSKGMPDVPWGDVYWAPVNKVAVSMDNPSGGVEGTAAAAKDVRAIVEMIQKGYLGVGTVVTSRELRGLLNKAGAGLTGDPFSEAGDEPADDIPADIPPAVDDPSADSTDDQVDESLAGPLGRAFLAELEAWRLTDPSPNGKAH